MQKLSRWFVLASIAVSAIASGCSGGGDDDDDDDGSTPACETNLTGIFSMQNGGNVVIDLYIDGNFEETLSIGETVEVTLSVGAYTQTTFINGGPLDGEQACLPDSFAIAQACDEIGPINCAVNI